MDKSQGNQKRVSIALIHRNPWNPNVQQEPEFEAVKSGLEAYGQVAPLVVRTHPTKEGHYELIDGEHRLRAMRELGTRYCDIYDLGFVPDSKAKKLTVVLSEARGANDALKLGALFKDLMNELDNDELLAGLPQGMGDIEDLVKLADYDWNQEAHNTGGSSTAPRQLNQSGTAQDEQEAQQQDPQTFVFGPYYLDSEAGRQVHDLIQARMEREPSKNESAVFADLVLHHD